MQPHQGAVAPGEIHVLKNPESAAARDAFSVSRDPRPQVGEVGTERSVGRPLTGRWLTLGEACEHLSVCGRTLRRFVQTGKISGYRLGSRALRFRSEDLDHLLTPINPADFADEIEDFITNTTKGAP